MFPVFMFCRKGADWCGKLWTLKDPKDEQALANARDKHEKRHSES